MENQLKDCLTELNTLCMRINIIRTTRWACLMIACSLVACTNSVVYSPSIQLPVSPLKRDCGQAMLGGEMLPETRPSVTTDKAAGGANALVRYAFSDRLTLQAKGWYALDKADALRSGFSFSAIVSFGEIGRASCRERV